MTMKTKEELLKILLRPGDKWHDRAYGRNGDYMEYWRSGYVIWFINSDMIKHFGKPMELRELSDKGEYDLTDGEYKYHSSWFGPAELLEKELFEI